ncbi:HD-GYP domain-containing protein [Paenibacillus sp.]|uniref:HD-GYP domain-containing protein n=1 Tax=Paenibacillus sp. TaxID=58172 RepID=UPI0028127DFA|nr:HD-GYP domain-containing protein [Paenibacillus sp.]
MLASLIGYVVKNDVFNEQGLLVIPANTQLSETHIELIKKHGITILPHHLKAPPDVAGGAPTPKLAENTNDVVVSHATEEMKDVFVRFRAGEGPSVSEMKTNLIPTIQEAIEFPTLFGLLSGLQAKDDYTFRHNIGVAVISTMIGKWLGLDSDKLQTLTLAAALHDIGKVKIEDDILNKPGKFTDEEYALMKRHTTYGHEILSGRNDLPPEVPLVALQHHERMDGRGYPFGISGDKMSYNSKIVAVADVFHAMTSNRVYRGEIPFYKVLLQMKEDAFGKMDPFICNLFVHRMMEMSIGSEVLLSNQATGNIVLVFPDDPIHPLVQVDNQFYDLRQHSQIYIERLVG